jgi:myosin heavy subunit
MSVCQRFKGQLAALVARLSATAPHFVRCIKPNTSLAANLFEPGLVLQQLRCCGVLEVVRISRMGYPTRYPHQVSSQPFISCNRMCWTHSLRHPTFMMGRRAWIG